VARVAAPLMQARRRGRIVNVSSGAGAWKNLGARTPAYALSKLGLNGLTRMLAAELRGSGVLVNAVCPGWVATDMGGEGGRPVEDGARGIVWAALLPDDGPSGGFFRDGRPIEW
jgi:NAD(P)-dependent dehydrogenase (short-subunit alcohol dehydrogenase family)